MKRLLLFSIALFAIWGRLFAYDFSAVAPSGQTLYYRIYSDSTVFVTYEREYNHSVLSPSYTNLTGSLIIPSIVTYNGAVYSIIGIDVDAFKDCTGLTDITIPNSVRKAPFSFEGCTSLSEPIYNDHLFAYFPCGYSDIYAIPDGITYIGAGAFSHCENLQSLIIPSTVDTIDGGGSYRPGSSTFDGCISMTSVYYTGTISGWCQIIFSEGGNPLSRAHNLYVNNTLVTDLVIPDDVTQIKAYAFEGATCLRTISIPNTVTIIGNYAFSKCEGLIGNLIIPNSVLDLGYMAFAECTGLTSANIGSSITLLKSAFGYCSGLTHITLPTSIRRIQASSFRDCSNLSAVYYAGNMADWCGIEFEYMYDNPLYYAHNLYINNNLVSNLVVPNNIRKINDFAFSGGSCFTSVDFGNSIDSIGAGAFLDCTGLLGELAIPNTVSYLGYHGGYYVGAFSGCSGLSTVSIGSRITTIPSCTFRGCTSLQTVNIGNSVSSIGHRVFQRCTSLQAIIIPGTIATIGGAVFDSCSSLSEIHMQGLVPPAIYESTFSGIPHSCIIYIPCERTTAYISESYWSNYLSRLIEDCSHNAIRSISLSEYKILNYSNKIVVSGVGDNEVIVYDVLGRVLHRGLAYAPIRVPSQGVYMVKVGESEPQKVFVGTK